MTKKKLTGMHSLIEWWVENENHQVVKTRHYRHATAEFDAEQGVDCFLLNNREVIIRKGDTYLIDAQSHEKAFTYNANRLNKIIKHHSQSKNIYVIPFELLQLIENPEKVGNISRWYRWLLGNDKSCINNLKFLDFTIFKEVYILEQNGVERYITSSSILNCTPLYYATNWLTEQCDDIRNIRRYGKKMIDVTFPDNVLNVAKDGKIRVNDVYNKVSKGMYDAFSVLQRVVRSGHDVSCFSNYRHLNVRKYDIPPAYLLKYKRNGKAEYWVLGIDDGSYYCSQIPKPKQHTITAALEAFKPKVVRNWEEANNSVALRQGEWYFMPELPVSPAIIKQAEWKNLPYQDGGNPHSVKLMRYKKSRYELACGTVRHRQHPLLALPKNWLCRYAKNTSTRDFSLSLLNVD